MSLTTTEVKQAQPQKKPRKLANGIAPGKCIIG